jgi:putative ABC transport system substrate-binding protein
MNSRRKVIVALAASMLAAPFDSFAQQQGKVWRVGFLGAGTRPTAEHPDANIDAFILGMRELGYIEGKNLSIEWQFAQGKYDRLPALALQLVQSRVEVLVTYGTAAAQALRTATSSVPIVIAASIDPVGSGFAASLAHPGGNITGLSAIAVDLSQKHLELLTDIIPKLSRVAVLVNPGNSGHPALLRSVQAAAKALNISILSTDASTANDIEQAFATARRNGAGAVIVAGDALFAGLGQRIAAAAKNNRLPSIGIYRDHVTAGALMSYGQNIAEFHRRAATYVDKIFKGAKPGDLPVEQPMTIGLFINGKTAKALGLTIPQSLLISADKVIE